MLLPAHAPVPTVDLFQQFCKELIALKWNVLNHASSSPAVPDPRREAPGDAVDGGQELAPGSPHIVWNRVVAFLDQQTLDVSRASGPVGLELYRETLYVMAALADETFVHLEWDGRDYWLAHLIEANFFQTHIAGERFFTRIDDLLKRDDDAAVETATVYLMALALGFRGKYWGSSFDSTLDFQRSRLFFFIVRRDRELVESGKRLFPAAYRNTIQAGPGRNLPAPRRWILVLAGAFIAWLITAQFLWRNLSGDLSARVCDLTPGCSPTGGQTVSKGGQ